MSKEKKRREKRSIVFPIVALLLFAGLFGVSSYKVVTQLTTEHKENQAFDDLLAQIQANRAAVESGDLSASVDAGDLQATPEQADGQAAAADETEKGAADDAEQGVTHDAEQGAADDTEKGATQPQKLEMLADYSSLYAQNSDLFGWIEIEDTKINYPVMHTPEDPERYLHRAFDGSYSASGVLFLAGECYMNCGNYIVYGHHMKNGTMFASIVSYKSEDYWKEHPVIRFDTLYERGTYEVIGAFYSKVYSENNTSAFKYYNYTDLIDPEVFEEYVARVKKAALYDTGIEAVYGDQLLTLSTCEYHAEDGRFVVVARKVP